MKVVITPRAEAFMRRMVRMGGARPGYGFRLVVSPGGCSGLTARFDVAEGSPGDIVLEADGFRIFLPAESGAQLDGATVDFAETPIEAGFTFVLPNAPSACSTAAAPPMATVTLESIRRGG